VGLTSPQAQQQLLGSLHVSLNRVEAASCVCSWPIRSAGAASRLECKKFALQYIERFQPQCFVKRLVSSSFASVPWDSLPLRIPLLSRVASADVPRRTECNWEQSGEAANRGGPRCAIVEGLGRQLCCACATACCICPAQAGRYDGPGSPNIHFMCVIRPAFQPKPPAADPCW
jgi:hypothetical protein